MPRENQAIIILTKVVLVVFSTQISAAVDMAPMFLWNTGLLTLAAPRGVRELSFSILLIETYR